MSARDCELCQERAAELALGVLDGRERAETLAHLQDCGRCQDLVADLATTVTRLFERLVPEKEPPPGLDRRIVEAITPTAGLDAEPSAPVGGDRTSRERIPVAIAVLAMVLLMAGGLVFSVGPRGAGSTAGPDLAGQVVQHTADMMSAPLIVGQQQIGTAYLLAHRPVWVVVSIARADDPSTATLNDRVSCDLVRKDGTSIALGSFALNDGHADWATDAAIDPGTLADARLTVRVGRVMSYASFARSMSGQGSGQGRPAAAATPSSSPGSPIGAATSLPASAPSNSTNSNNSTKQPKEAKDPKDPKAPKKDSDGTDTGSQLTVEALKAADGVAPSAEGRSGAPPARSREKSRSSWRSEVRSTVEKRPERHHRRDARREDGRKAADLLKGLTRG